MRINSLAGALRAFTPVFATRAFTPVFARSVPSTRDPKASTSCMCCAPRSAGCSGTCSIWRVARRRAATGSASSRTPPPAAAGRKPHWRSCRRPRARHQPRAHEPADRPAGCGGRGACGAARRGGGRARAARPRCQGWRLCAAGARAAGGAGLHAPWRQPPFRLGLAHRPPLSRARAGSPRADGSDSCSRAPMGATSSAPRSATPAHGRASSTTGSRRPSSRRSRPMRGRAISSSWASCACSKVSTC